MQCAHAIQLDLTRLSHVVRAQSNASGFMQALLASDHTKSPRRSPQIDCAAADLVLEAAALVKRNRSHRVKPAKRLKVHCSLPTVVAIWSNYLKLAIRPAANLAIAQLDQVKLKRATSCQPYRSLAQPKDYAACLECLRLEPNDAENLADFSIAPLKLTFLTITHLPASSDPLKQLNRRSSAISHPDTSTSTDSHVTAQLKHARGPETLSEPCIDRQLTRKPDSELKSNLSSQLKPTTSSLNSTQTAPIVTTTATQ